MVHEATKITKMKVSVLQLNSIPGIVTGARRPDSASANGARRAVSWWNSAGGSSDRNSTLTCPACGKPGSAGYISTMPDAGYRIRGKKTIRAEGNLLVGICEQPNFFRRIAGIVTHAVRLFSYVTLVGACVVCPTGCNSTGLYKGRVILAETKEPVPGVEVRGSCLYRERFSPSLDGFFVRKNKSVSTVTDAEGKFELALGGYNRRIAVFQYGYKPVKLFVDNWPQQKEVLIELVPETGD